MPVPTRHAIALAVGVACLFASAPLAAQKDKSNNKDKAKACAIDDNSPAELIQAKLYLQKGNVAKADTAEQNKNYKLVVGSLTGKGAKINNPVGREYVLSQAYVALINRPAGSTTGTRGSFGMSDNQGDPVDLLASTDTLLTALGAAKPECAAAVQSLREQIYVPMVNNGIHALQAGQMDTAAAYAKKAQTIYPQGPYGYNLSASVALKQKDLPGAIAGYQKVVELAGTDTLYTKLKQGALYNVAAIQLQQADAATGADKTADAQKAAESWKVYLAANPDDADGKAALARALQLSGDTAAVTNTYKEMLANPTKFTDVQLFQAGIVAARASHTADADSLFSDGLAQNPNYADAIHYIANDAFNAKQADKLLPLAKRAIELDPNNPDNYRLLAGAFQLRSHDDKVPTAKRMDNDSTVYYYNKYKTMPLVLTVSKFAHASATSIEMAGTVENRGTTPKTVTLKMQLIDKAGQPVTGQEIPLTIPPGSSAPFSFTATGSGIAAYKYAPLE